VDFPHIFASIFILCSYRLQPYWFMSTGNWGDN
jgi:hypothetical protein